MKYLLLEYGEAPIQAIGMPRVKYCYDRNLTVLEETGKPAIDLLENHLATETFTRVDSETPDSDDNYQMSLATQTRTFVDAERPDSDANNYSFAAALITGTTTKVEMESTDQD